MIFVCGYSYRDYLDYCSRRKVRPGLQARWVCGGDDLRGVSIYGLDEVIWGPDGDFNLWKAIKAAQTMAR